MIDIESKVFDAVATAIRVRYPDAFVTGEYVASPSSFPCVSLVEMDNTTDEQTQTSGCMENHANLMYQLDVYSNRKVGKKGESRAIAALVDNEMAALGFSRTMLQPIPNMDDGAVYRITGRYTAKASKENIIYRR